VLIAGAWAQCTSLVHLDIHAPAVLRVLPPNLQRLRVHGWAMADPQALVRCPEVWLDATPRKYGCRAGQLRLLAPEDPEMQAAPDWWVHQDLLAPNHATLLAEAAAAALPPSGSAPAPAAPSCDLQAQPDQLLAAPVHTLRASFVTLWFRDVLGRLHRVQAGHGSQAAATCTVGAVSVFLHCPSSPYSG